MAATAVAAFQQGTACCGLCWATCHRCGSRLEGACHLLHAEAAVLRINCSLFPKGALQRQRLVDSRHQVRMTAVAFMP